MPLKPLLFSPHARFEMRRRAITSSEVARAIEIPGQVLASRKGRQIYQFKLRSDQLLRVVVKEERNAYHVITAYKRPKSQNTGKGT